MADVLFPVIRIYWHVVLSVIGFGSAYLLMEAYKPQKWLLMRFFKYLCLASTPFLLLIDATKTEEVFYTRLDTLYRIEMLEKCQMYTGNLIVGFLFCILIALTITHLLAPLIIDRRERRYEQEEDM